MLRKLFVAGAAVAALSAFSVLTPLWSYTRCALSWAKQTAGDAVPLEWEMKRARQMIGDLEPEIAKSAKQIAREKVELARLQRQAERSGETLEKARHDIERLTADLRSGDSKYTYGGYTYTSAEVRDDLASRFDRFQTRQETYDQLRKMIAAREASLRSAGQKMDAMLAARSQLEVEIENLQARVSSLRVAQTAGELNLDDSRLSQTRELLDDIAARIEVEEEIAATEIQPVGGINLDSDEQEDLLDRISSYLKQSDDAGRDAEALTAVRID